MGLLTCRKAGVRDAVGKDGLDRLRGLISELVTSSVGMSSRTLGFFDLPLWLQAGDSDISEPPDSEV